MTADKLLTKIGGTLGLLILLPLLLECRSPVWDDQVDELDLSQEYNAPGAAVYHISTSGVTDLNYTLTKLNNSTVYFVFTNPSQGSAATNPTVEGAAPPESSGERGIRPQAGSSPRGFSIGLRGKPEISAFNRQAIALAGGPDSFLDGGVARRGLSLEPLALNLDDKETLYDDKGMGVAATLKKLVSGIDTSFGFKTLAVWVADSHWSDPEVYGKVGPGRVDILANEFLISGASKDNDIYDWTTNIFGQEWGSHVYSNLISESDEVHILLYDIDGDGLPAPGESRVVGFFYAKDNFYKTSNGQPTDYSNQRIMFYLDAALYGAGLITDYWPSTVISTLAHEFQHMIHFYQKSVLRVPEGRNSETWINEMLSVVTEDLLSHTDKLGVDGPRGINSSDGSAGSPDISKGWPGIYNKSNDIAVNTWSGELENYAINYALGAYLARNFGGGALFRDILHSSHTDYQALDQALAPWGESFDSVLRKWGAAVLLSDQTSLPGGSYAYNSGSWFDSNLGGITYKLGSINMFNYLYEGQRGPSLYTGSTVGQAYGMRQASNALYLAGQNLSGTHTWEVRLDEEVRLTVVVK